MTNKPKRNFGFFSFSKIKSLKESEDLIKECFRLFLIVGLLLIGISIIFFFFIQTDLTFGFLVDGFVYTLLSLIFYFKKSRTAAIILLVISAIGMITTIMNKLGLSKGGSNIFLAFFVLIGGINAVRATFAYYKFLKSKNKDLTQ